MLHAVEVQPSLFFSWGLEAFLTGCLSDTCVGGFPMLLRDSNKPQRRANLKVDEVGSGDGLKFGVGVGPYTDMICL